MLKYLFTNSADLIEGLLNIFKQKCDLRILYNEKSSIMKKRNLSLSLFFFLLFTVAYSQKVTKKVTKDICGCFEKIDNKQSIEILERRSELCITDHMMNHAEGLIKEYDIKEGDEKGAQKMTEAIGTKLIQDCPSALAIFTIIGNSKEENSKVEIPEDEMNEE